MILSRNWLNEFVPNVSVNDIDDKAFSEAMTISGSKVEITELKLNKDRKNILERKGRKATGKYTEKDVNMANLD